MRLRTGLTGKRRRCPPPGRLCRKRGTHVQKSQVYPGQNQEAIVPERVPTDWGPEATGADRGAIVDPCRAIGYPWSEEGKAAGFPAPRPHSTAL